MLDTPSVKSDGQRGSRRHRSSQIPLPTLKKSLHYTDTERERKRVRITLSHTDTHIHITTYTNVKTFKYIFTAILQRERHRIKAHTHTPIKHHTHQILLNHSKYTHRSKCTQCFTLQVKIYCVKADKHTLSYLNPHTQTHTEAQCNRTHTGPPAQQRERHKMREHRFCRLERETAQCQNSISTMQTHYNYISKAKSRNQLHYSKYPLMQHQKCSIWHMCISEN